MRRITIEATFEGFRDGAKAALARGDSPDAITLCAPTEAQGSLFAQPDARPTPAAAAASAPLHLPRRFVEACQVVAHHRDSRRWDVMYRLLWRQAHGEKELLQDPADNAVVEFWRMHKAVQHDVHNCHAYVRFRPVTEPGGPRPHYIAWYEPDHPCLALAAPHFAERLGAIDWTLMTPDACALCQGGTMTFGPGVHRAEAQSAGSPDDGIEVLWHTYYRSIFNPARLNMKATRQQMPQRFWKNMPETQLIAELQAGATTKMEAYVSQQPKPRPALSALPTLDALADAVRACTACPWAAQATQAVVGAGDSGRPLMVVGEQPGDQEDLAGLPFVGPAGKVLAEGLEQAGISREVTYVTNAVKHFKFEMRGKRRIHQKPLAKDVAACHDFLAAEWQLLRPQVLLCLGTTAALAVFGKAVKLKDVRGVVHATAACAKTFVTTHPSAILRMPPEAQEAAMAQFVADLTLVRGLLMGVQ